MNEQMPFGTPAIAEVMKVMDEYDSETIDKMQFLQAIEEAAGR